MRRMTSSSVRSENSAVNSPSFMRVLCRAVSGELVQVVETHARAFERGPVPVVLLDIVVPYARFRRGREDFLPVDDTGTDFGERVAFESVCGWLVAAFE